MYEIVVTVRATIKELDDVDMVLEDIKGLFEGENMVTLIGIFDKPDI